MSHRELMKNQVGSTVSFLVVGLALILLVAGGVYAVHQQSSLRNAATGTTTSKKTSDSSKDKTTDRKVSKETVLTETKSDTSAPESVGKGAKSTGTTGAAAVGDALPESGLSDGLTSVVVLALLTGVMVSYVRSRRELALTVQG